MNKNQIRSLINKSEPIIFEIGCADGSDTQEFISVFNDLNFKMYCFEPDHRNRKAFKSKIFDKRINLISCAIGNEDKDDMLFYESGKDNRTGNQDVHILSSSIRPPTETLFKTWPDMGEFNKISVRSMKLDTFVNLHNIDIISFIWADVQGCEDLMIEGGIETFNNKVRFLYTEYSNNEYYKNEPTLQKILSMLPNFSIVQDFGTDVLLKNNNL